ncbi:MAG: hypothetical protein ACOC2D_11840 [Spirochaetota bacterium]
MSNPSFSAATDFILANARLLERRIFAALYGDGDGASVAAVVSAYRNADGGLGHALEPDIRCAESQPLFVEEGLAALEAVGAGVEALAIGLCDYLSRVCDPRGLVAPIVGSALTAPHAAHWTERALEPGLNPTAGICGLLHAQRVRHDWLERATESCVAAVRAQPPAEAHSLRCVARLAEYHPDPTERSSLREIVAAALPGSSFYLADASASEYGLTPLAFAVTADSPWRELFTPDQLEAHLHALAAEQQDDGGWPIRWQPPSAAAVQEWRGYATLGAVRTLVSYGVLDAS